jgi:perosamine synthetase
MLPIPVSEPLLNGNERQYLNQCLDSGWISSEGPFSRRFEEQFAKRVGRRHGIAVCNGSAALQAAVAALGIGPGDEVILPSFTIISCAASVVRSGAKPVLVDSDPATWNLATSRLESLITVRTKAIMVVHTYGLPVDMDPVLALAARHGLHIIEDAAEMHGQTYRGKPCGGFGSISTFSFYPNKNVTTGEGGMILTDDDALAERCRGLRNLCFQPAKRFVHEELGWNMRMSNLNAALGLAQLERIDEFVGRKRRLGSQYNALLSDIDGVQLPVPLTDYAENIYWVYGIVLDDRVPVAVDEVMTGLADRGIETRPFFWPMHLQPVFCRMGMFPGVSCPVAEHLGRRGLYLPSGLTLGEEQIEYVSKMLREVLNREVLN